MYSIQPETAIGVKTYGIQVDKKTGAALSAPSPDMLRMESKKYKEFTNVNDNTDLYTFNEFNQVNKPVFWDKLNQPLYEDDLLNDYPRIYLAWKDGIITTQNDFDKALLNPDYDSDDESQFLF